MPPFEKRHEITRGKAKTLYATDDEDFLLMEFRDDVSAFDGVKIEQLADKGRINNLINAYIMQELYSAGIPTHFHSTRTDTSSLVYKLEMLPIECVIRNISAGSICRRLGIDEGIGFAPPVFEFFLKDDELHDPLINESHMLNFKWATTLEIEMMKDLSHRINAILVKMFQVAELQLVDFKLEFGWYRDQLCLGDEFTPDGCRLWDWETGESFDKDRFRKDQGDVVKFYKEVADRLGVEY